MEESRKIHRIGRPFKVCLGFEVRIRRWNLLCWWSHVQ